MYGIYANIGGIWMVNVTIYSIHGSYGNGDLTHKNGNLSNYHRDLSNRHGDVTNIHGYIN
jgi:hypothetical protein